MLVDPLYKSDDVKAPTSGKKRTSIRAKTNKIRPALPLSQPIEASTGSLFSSSKKDKQKIKHSSFVSKIEKPSSSTKKRRRPNKKLVANLESLADALSGIEDDGGEGNGDVVVGQAKIQRKSLKSRPGAMKRKEKLEKMERDRFNANLAQMASANSGADRWAALKSHVKSTVEQKPEFTKK
jgi:hypothetical protein